MFDLVQMQQAIGVRRLIRFGTTMGIALAGQVFVTILIGTLPWVQQHVLVMVLIELLWWPPFFCILYFSFTGVVRLVKLGIESYQMLHEQIEALNQDYEGRSRRYEIHLQEKERRIQHLARSVRSKMSVTRLEPWEQELKQM
jgi:hypothetical protein